MMNTRLVLDSVSTDTVMQATQTVLLVDATSAAVTVTLPPATSRIGLRTYVKKTDTSANAVTVDAHASEQIDGATTAIITTGYDCLELVSDGFNWWII